MTANKERELISRLRKGDRIAREELISSVMKFAKYIAKDYARDGSFWEFDDLLQECYVGLIKAVNRVAKVGLKDRFLAYANKAMRNEVRKSLRTKSYIIKSNRHFAKLRKINHLMGAITHMYDNTGFNFMVEPDRTPGRLALHDKLIDILDEFLTLEEEDIIKLKYGFGHVYFDTPDWQKPNKPLTREKIAKIQGCSIKRILVHEDKAMKKLQMPEVQLKLMPWL